jgi:hypothetical protein
MNFQNLCISCLLSIHVDVPHIKKYLCEYYEKTYLLFYIYKNEQAGQCILHFSHATHSTLVLVIIFYTPYIALHSHDQNSVP